MAQSVSLTGMVLTAMPVGEYDKRITILTRERGKITAFVRGARRPNSSMLAATAPFAFGEFEAFRGRNAYTVVKASISNYFRELSEDLEKAGYGFYFLELADYFVQENGDGTEQLKLLYQTLRALNVKSLDHRLVRCIYELRTLVIQGIYPDFFSCMSCGTKDKIHAFHGKSHGVLCDSCYHPDGTIFLPDSALYALQYIVTSPLGKLYTFIVTPEILDVLERVCGESMKLAVDREFKTLDFLGGIILK